MTITLRWLGVHHMEAVENDQSLRGRQIITLLAIAITIGGLTGFFLTRWTDATVRGLRDIHSRLQTAAADPAQAGPLLPLNDVPGLVSHFNTRYTLHGKPSAQSVVAVDVKVTFSDGYQMACALLVFPDTPPFLRACMEGEQAALP
jgi:hypothetical protein